MANIGIPNHVETSAGRGSSSSSSSSREEGEKKQDHGHTNAAVAVAATVAASGNDDKMQLAGYELDTAPSGSSSVVNKKNGHLRLGSDDGGGGDANDPGRIASLGPDASEDAESGGEGDANSAHYKVYKRRWFGLLQLTLMNIIVSWDVS